ncbi:Prolyl 4-hydroxylase subunit alpha-2, partial [Armadillidium vulgare]
MKNIILIPFTLLTLSLIITVEGLKQKAPLGSLFTSTAFIDPLIKIESSVVEELSNYVEKEEKKLRYINEFTWEDPSLYQKNPLGSFHLFKRMKTEFDKVRREIMNNNSLEVLESIDTLRGPNSDLPTDEDINGIAWALVHLQDVYDIPVDHLVDGRIKNSTIGKELDAILKMTGVMRNGQWLENCVSGSM